MNGQSLHPSLPVSGRIGWLWPCGDVSADLGRRAGDHVRGRHGRAGWPTTYGYNMFLYPWQTWLAGPWDLFIEHGHRLLGALVGLYHDRLRRGRVAARTIGPGCAWRRGGVGGGDLSGRAGRLARACSIAACWPCSTAASARRFSRCRSAGGCHVAVVARNAAGGAIRRPALRAAGDGLARLAYVQLVLGAQLRHRDPVGDPRPVPDAGRCSICSVPPRWWFMRSCSLPCDPAAGRSAARPAARAWL